MKAKDKDISYALQEMMIKFRGNSYHLICFTFCCVCYVVMGTNICKQIKTDTRKPISAMRMFLFHVVVFLFQLVAATYMSAAI